MSSTIVVDENNRELNDLLDRVEAEGSVVLERDGKVVAMARPLPALPELIQRVHEANRHIPSEEIEHDIAEAIREARAERRARREAAAG